jgi:hypothetical protein
MFDIRTSRDFYAMLVEDFDDYVAEPHSTRRALHCAITAYHLHEWVWGDWLKKDLAIQKELGINSKKAFEDWVGGACAWFPDIRDLVNGTKHFSSGQGFETMRVAAAPFAFDQLEAGLDQGAFDGPIPFLDSDQTSGGGAKGCLPYRLRTGRC